MEVKTNFKKEKYNKKEQKYTEIINVEDDL